MQRTADPDALGLDPARLARIDEHFAPLRRRRPAGRLADRRRPARRGRARVHVRARATVEAGLPGRARHALAHLLDDQADHLGGGDDAVRAGPLRAHRPGQPLHPVVRRRAGLRRRARRQRRAPSRPTEPMRIWHLLTHTAGLTYGFHHAHRRRRDLPRRGLRARACPPGIDLGRGVRHLGRRCRCCSSPAPRGTTRSPPTCSAGSSRWSPGSRSTSSSPSRSSGRWAWPTPAFWVEPERRRAPRRALHPEPGDRQAVRFDAFGDAALHPPTFLSGGGGLVSTAADYHRFTADAAARRRARRRAPARHRARCAT